MGFKAIVCNVPQRSEDMKTAYPPLGAMYVTQAALKAGFDTEFFDINYQRPSDHEIQDFFKVRKPNVVGISATVSTSYAYTKKLTELIRKSLPDSKIVVGGAITASSDILLKFTDTDICCVAEGEKTFINLLNHFSRGGNSLSDIKGISFLGDKEEVKFTGYEDQLSIDEIPDPDYSILHAHSSIDGYIIEPWYYEQFKYDSRSLESHRKGKKMATVVTSRGCVARCTFCHRWQKGIRIIPVDRIIEHIRFLMEKYNVGFVSIGDEDFGASEKWMYEFIEKVSALNIIYRVGATRVDHVDFPILKGLKESGCVAVHHGFESGSNRILKVMEKRTTVDMNTAAAHAIRDAGMQTVPAVVVGMPGENFSTIEETCKFLRDVTYYYPYNPIVSPNLLVALPGTPVYEYARFKGFLGTTLEDEENYLLRVSDHGGGSTVHFNFTDYPYFVVQSWARCMIISVYYNYALANNLQQLTTAGLILKILKYPFMRKGNRSFSSSVFSHPLVYHYRYVITPIFTIAKNFYETPFPIYLQRWIELLVWPFKRKEFTEYISLRDFMNKKTSDIHEIKSQPTNLMLLRLGR